VKTGLPNAARAEIVRQPLPRRPRQSAAADRLLTTPWMEVTTRWSSA
jgi:hypothetical protein